MKKKIIYSSIACLVLVMATVLLLPHPTNAISKIKKEFEGFVLTANPAEEETNLVKYITKEGDPVIVQPGLGDPFIYSPLMSSVPGFPLTAGIAGVGKENLTKISIKISVDNGSLFNWNRTTSQVSVVGESILTDIGQTVYWGPCQEEIESFVSEGLAAIIRIDAIADGAVIAQQCVYITREDDHFYYATAGELELS